MRKLAILITVMAIGLFLVSCGGSTSTTPTTPATAPATTPVATTTPPASSAPAIDAQALFTTDCSVCHGQNREGNTALNAPALTPSSLGDESIAAISGIITNGVNATAMVGWQGRLTSAQIDALATFVKTVTPAATPNAAAIYSSKCALCHGASRQGTPALNAPALTPTSLADDSLVQVTSIISDGVVTNGTPTAMLGFKTSLSSAEISALSTYLKTVAP